MTRATVLSVTWLHLNRLLVGLAAMLLILEILSRSPLAEIVPTATCLVVFVLGVRRDQRSMKCSDPPSGR